MANYLFNYQEFVEELRNDENKQVIQEYEKKVLNGDRIVGDVKDQIWYKEYLALIPPQKFRTPEDINDIFDWDLLFQLIAGSYSSEYWLEPIKGSDLDELFVEVDKPAKIKKKISELWSFQILRLFEIYCEEQMNVQIHLSESIEKEDKEEIRAIEKEREEKLKPHRKIKDSVVNILSPPTENNNKVYFYCSLESAFNIIKSSVIFSSDLSYMNDADELTFGIDILIAALQEIASKQKTDDELKGWINSFINNQDYRRELREHLKKDPIYISCFTRKHDDLNQWRAYGDNGYGVCLHFDFNMLLGDSGSDDFYMDDVIYLHDGSKVSENIKLDKWIDELETIEEMFKRFYDSLEANTSDFSAILQSNTIPYYIKRRIRFYKNITFKEEEEFRQVCLNENEKYQKKIRVRKEYLVPYIELPLRKSISKRIKGRLTEEWGDSSLVGITIGPAVKDFNKAERSFKLFFEEFDKENKTKYSQIPLLRSEIPYLP